MQQYWYFPIKDTHASFSSHHYLIVQYQRGINFKPHKHNSDLIEKDAKKNLSIKYILICECKCILCAMKAVSCQTFLLVTFLAIT